MLILQGALANVNQEVSNEELLDYLKENLPEAEFYKLSPKPGSIMAATFDWQVILNSTASVITIAGVLWSAYKKFIAPQRLKGNTTAFLFISLKNKDKRFIQFCIGEQYKDEQEFSFFDD
jgi:hypothetical protein